MSNNTKTLASGFITGGMLFVAIFFGLNYRGQNIYATIGLTEEIGEQTLQDNSLISDAVSSKPALQSKILMGKVSHPQYIQLKNTLRYINNKTGEIEEYDFNKKEILKIGHMTQGVRLVNWNNQGNKLLMFSPFGARYLDIGNKSSTSLDQTIMRPVLNEDGTKIAFLKANGDATYTISISDPQLNNEVSILQTRNISWSIKWLSDTKLILTNIKNPVAQQVYLLDTATKELKPLTEEEIIENINVVDEENIFVRLTNEDGDSITDIISINTGERHHMDALDGNTICSKTKNSKTLCAKFNNNKNETLIDIYQRDGNGIINKTNSVKISQDLRPEDIFTNYDDSLIIIFDSKYNQIIQIPAQK